MISDIFESVNEVHELVIYNGDILVSYDVSSLFTNVPLEETIQLLADKAFINNWFNETYHLNLNKLDLVDLLRAATTDQLFTFNGQLYEQTDGVAIGSPLGPLLANAFMRSIEETLSVKARCPPIRKRFADDTLTIVPNKASADNFLDILNSAIPLLSSPWRRRVIACFLFWAPSCSTSTHMLRLRCTLNPQIQTSCYITRAM